MLMLHHGKPFHCLDNYIDVETFLKLEEDFYFCYAKSNPLDRCDTFGGAGIPESVLKADLPENSAWNYVLEPPNPYWAYHRALAEGDPKTLERIKYFKDNHRLQDLCIFLQLRYGAFNPYKKLHLLSKKGTKDSFVPLLDDFPEIRNWLSSLPFEVLNECQLILVDHYYVHKYHRDFDFFPIEKGHQPMPDPEKMDDWIWLRFDLDRGFNLYDLDDDGNILETIPVEGYCVTMNNMNWHGNTGSYPKHSLTVKIEGKLTEEFKKKVFNK